MRWMLFTVVGICFGMNSTFAGDGGSFTAPNVNGASNLGNPIAGDIVYDTSTNGFYGYASGSWALLGALVPLVPPGIITSYGGATAPTGWLICDGSAVSRATYSALFAAIGSAYGAGDGSTTFNLPDLRGRFLRGVDGSASNDPNHSSRTAMNSGGNSGNAVGSMQGDQMQGHYHGSNIPSNIDYYVGSGGSFAYSHSGTYDGQFWATTTVTSPSSDGTNGTPRVGSETRPVNAYVNFLIKI